MKYTIKMSCGHEETIALIGHHEERDRKIKFFETEGLCKECYRKKMEADAEKEGLLFNATVLPSINEKNGTVI